MVYDLTLNLQVSDVIIFNISNVNYADCNYFPFERIEYSVKLLLL